MDDNLTTAVTALIWVVVVLVGLFGLVGLVIFMVKHLGAADNPLDALPEAPEWSSKTVKRTVDVKPGEDSQKVAERLLREAEEEMGEPVPGLFRTTTVTVTSKPVVKKTTKVEEKDTQETK